MRDRATISVLDGYFEISGRLAFPSNLGYKWVQWPSGNHAPAWEEIGHLPWHAESTKQEVANNIHIHDHLSRFSLGSCSSSECMVLPACRPVCRGVYPYDCLTVFLSAYLVPRVYRVFSVHSVQIKASQFQQCNGLFDQQQRRHHCVGDSCKKSLEKPLVKSMS